MQGWLIINDFIKSVLRCKSAAFAQIEPHILEFNFVDGIVEI